MGNNVRQAIEIPVAAEGFSAAQAYVEDALKLRFLSPEIAQETTLVFEAVFNTVLEQGVDPSTTMSITCRQLVKSPTAQKSESVLVSDTHMLV